MGPESKKDSARYFVQTEKGWEPISIADVSKILAGEAGEERELKIKEAENEMCSINRVIFSGPATIVFWSDGTKTIVKCMDGDHYSYEMGIYAATLKKIFGESYSVFKKDVHDIVTEEIEAREAFLNKLKEKVKNSESDKEAKSNYEYGKTWSVTS